MCDKDQQLKHDGHCNAACTALTGWLPFRPAPTAAEFSRTPLTLKCYSVCPEVRWPQVQAHVPFATCWA